MLDINEKLNVQYCIPLWLRDEQIKLSSARVRKRLLPEEQKKGPVAIACYGPSLNDTWEMIGDFDTIISCSGAHKFLVDRGIIPTHHVEVDPREHKVILLGEPQKETKYLISSTCHPKYFDHLEGFDVALWHVFANTENDIRLLPRNEWALTGGSSVGLRAMTIARFLGFTDLHVFGMDGCEGASGKHAASHPSQPKGYQETEYKGKVYKTTSGMLECAKQTFHELDQMADVKATFYGDGLVQELAKDYKPKHIKGSILGYSKPALISEEYRNLNAQLHVDNLAYGVGGAKHAKAVKKLCEALKTTSVLDYGCGKGYLGKELNFPIWEYDPAIPGKEESPRPADIVVCTDVLEHIEEDKILLVLDDIKRCTKKLAYFVIHTGPSGKHLPDGRNTHILQRELNWWTKTLSRFFQLGKPMVQEPLIHIVAVPKEKKNKNA